LIFLYSYFYFIISTFIRKRNSLLIVKYLEQETIKNEIEIEKPKQEKIIVEKTDKKVGKKNKEK
jgi:hypothetical protein